jgi:hypothetical protein
METSASFEARYAPSSYPPNRRMPPPGQYDLTTYTQGLGEGKVRVRCGLVC